MDNPSRQNSPSNVIAEELPIVGEEYIAPRLIDPLYIFDIPRP